jgi:phenylpropionate dioxygenase-like ring-hydroxylating dioxygenase large terminal subunit
MIRNQWYIVLESNEVKKNRPVGVTRMGEKLVFWRTLDGKVVCMRDLCPHLGAQLHQGIVKANHLACPFHGFEYDADGECKFLPAYGRNGNIPKALKAGVYPTFEGNGFIWIWWGKADAERDQPQWLDIDESFSYSSFNEVWNVHYSRMVENQLDVMHLPFVHATTIGRGGRYVVDGPLVKLEKNVMKLWVHNRHDDGTPPKKAEDLPEPQRPPFLVFIFPNLWQNRISEDLRIVAAFVPIDEEHGKIYLRFYQRFMRVPLLRNFVNWMGTLSNRYILHQDRHVVNEQRPKKTTLKKMGEKLMQGDRAILTYRMHRYELQKAAGQLTDEES